ncbi:hypothetical protein CHUAL_008165 [Chamberlinius hualienensis]
MPGDKKKGGGLFSKFRLGSAKKVEKADEGVSGESGSGVVVTKSGLEIPLIRADDAGAAIDDLQQPFESVDVVVGDGVQVPVDAASSSVKRDSFTTSPIHSPSPSIDRLSVSFSPDLPSPTDNMTSAVDSATSAADSKVRFSKDRHLSATGPDDDDDDELSESLDAMLRRRESGRRRSVIRRSPKRGASPLGSDSEAGGKSRRRSSTMTSTSCEETQISIEEPELTEEQMFENIKVHKELIEQVKKQPWKMRKRLKIVRKAKAYVRKHEGELVQRLAQSKNTKDVMARYSLIFFRYWGRLNRFAVNFAKSMIPWEMRIKRIESHFGSAVASYFVFLRWVFWINIVMSVLIACFVIIPEVLAADRSAARDRKEPLPGEEAKAFNLQTLWDFEGFLRYSPIFYGYYTNNEKTRQGYRIPFAYFMTLLGVYGYSFAAILQRMAENTRQSKQSDKDEDCTFTWKLFTSWDYMIGNSETADNKVASILMGFKENILEEREKSKDEHNWKIWALRVLANILVLILLVSSAYAVVLVVERSKYADNSWWRQNEATVVISLISLLYPNFFDLIGLLEHNHPRTQLRFQLARIMILYLLNLYTLILSLFSKVEDMSAELKELKPNATLAPEMTTMSSTTTFNSGFIPGGNFPTFLNGTVGPMLNLPWNESQIPYPTNHIKELFQMLNLSLYYHQTWIVNDTCLAARINCYTKEFLVIGNDNVSATQPSATVGSTLDYSDDGLLWSGIAKTGYYLNYTAAKSIMSLPLVLLPKGLQSFYNVTQSTQPSIANLLFQTTTSDYDSDSSPIKQYRPPYRTPTYPTSRYKNNRRKPTTSYDSGYRTTRAASRYPSADMTTYSGPYESSPQYPLFNDSMDDSSSTPNPTDDTEGILTVAPGYCIIIKCSDFATPTSITDDYYDPKFRSTTKSADDMSDDAQNATATSVDHAVTLSQAMNMTMREKLRRLCWETMFGQDLVKLTVMDLIMTVISIIITDFIRALIVRVFNHCCCWDLEKQFPGYGDFKIAENILHLVNNQGMIWMGMFFAPGIPGINMVKIVIIMYVRSWAVLTCNIPHETVFKASNSSNFYYVLLLTMLFLCTLPVGYAIVWLDPSWHCGPFSQYSKIYRIFTSMLESVLPSFVIRWLGYAASPGIMIPLLVLLILIIYYLNSVANSLREANKDLKDQLRRERTEERRKVFQMADSRHDSNSKWTVTKKILPVLPSKVKMLQLATQQLKEHIQMHELRPIKKEDGKEKHGTKEKDDDDDELNIIKPSQIKKGKSKDKLTVELEQINKSESDEKTEDVPKLKESKTSSNKKTVIEKSNGKATEKTGDAPEQSKASSGD